MCAGTEQGNGKAVSQVDESEQHGAEQVHHSRQSEDRRQDAYWNQGATKQNDLASGASTAAVH